MSISPNTHKTCTVCKENLPLENFVKDNRAKDGRGARCRPCFNSSKTYSPERQRRYKLKHFYNITPEKYDNMLESQGGACKICDKKFSTYHVDHDHKSGKVRGLLCHSCNVMLGHAFDNPSILTNAITYLNESTGG